MSSDTPKPSSKARAKSGGGSASREAAKPPKTTGRVQFDDRGNAVWEWSVATGAFGADVSTQRLKKLEHPALSIADDGVPENLRSNPLGTKKGYDPYDSGRLSKTAPPPKKDLKRLSEWLRLKKQAENNNKDEE